MITRTADIGGRNVRLGGLGLPVIAAGALAGIAGLAAAGGMAARSPEQARQFFSSYLASYMYFLSFALGGLFLVLLEHLVHAGWSVAVRRVTEWVTASLPWLGLLFVPVLLGLAHTYAWADPQAHFTEHQEHLLEGKRAYLNEPFFAVRAAIYFVAWLAMGWFFLGRSLLQDRQRDLEASAALTRRMEALAPPAMVLFALTITFAAFDWLMSRDPFWYSTVYGVYYFAGCVVSTFALVTAVTFLLQTTGRLRDVVSVDHYQDLGKYTFGFTVFWAYIAFSQYLLIWYGNIPEETEWYLRRQTGQWGYVSAALVVGHFFLPFFALISRTPKRRPALLTAVCVWILAIHWLDVYWLAMPEFSPQAVPLSWMDVATFVGIGGICTAGATLWQRRQLLVARGDPRLGESLAFENA